jgi:hypothetical protein
MFLDDYVLDFGHDDYYAHDADEGVELVGWGGDCSGVGLCAAPLGRCGYRFVRWGGDCAGRKACVVDAEATVTALFRR